MINKTSILTGVLVISSAFVSAQKAKLKTLIIGPERVKCMSINQQGDCYQLKTSKKQKNWENFSMPIKGFDYKPGFEYTIQVKTQKPKEALEGATEEYVFVKQISKKKAK